MTDLTSLNNAIPLFRICFQIELAHWFYLDFHCAHKEQKLTSCGIKQFALHMFNHVPYLRPHLNGVDKILEDWKQYKLSVPTYGAIIISAETPKHVLLVQSYFAKSSWGFPKGKINEHEDPVHCAIREVYEETGFDTKKYIKPNDYVELVINFQYTRLYFVEGVPMDTKFAPRTRKEIKSCEWFPVDLLPSNKYQMEAKTLLGIGPNSFFMILPFIKRLKRWLNGQQISSDKKAKSLLGTGIGNTTVNTSLSLKKNRTNPNISTFHYETACSGGGGTPKDNNGTFFPGNQKLNIATNGSNSRNRTRNKSMGEAEGGGFKLANFDLPTPAHNQKLLPLPLQHSTPKEPRRKLVFDGGDKFDKILERPRPIKPFGKFAQDRVKVWTNFRLDKQRLISVMGL